MIATLQSSLTSSRRVVSIITTLTFFLILTLAPSLIRADDHSHKYGAGEEVTFWLNKIGPYHNPQETYSYYYLPFCKPEQPKTIKVTDDSLGVILEGDELSDSGLVVQFEVTQKDTIICHVVIDEDAEEKFNEAVQNHYWYQMYIDELPIWGMVGEYMQADAVTPAETKQTKATADVAGEQGYIYTHKEFSISTNKNQIIEVNLTSDSPKPIINGAKYPMTFSVNWSKTDKPFASRFDRYLDFDFFEHQIHWFSIFNSFMMVVFLCGLVALILMRTLRNDYARYTSEDEEMELDRVVDESGWKQVHGDVFRPPKQLLFYSSLIGTGYQLFFLVLATILLTLVATMYDERGSLMTAALAIYCLTSLIAGYTGSALYKRYGGTAWKEQMLLTAILYPGLCFAVAFALNLIALSYDSSASLSPYTMLAMLGIFFFISCPLVLLGTIMGRSTSIANDFPCRVNSIKRPIPEGKWYTKPMTMALFSGILPFGSIFIEMYFIFTSFWNYKFYYVYGFMFLVFVILLIVTICVTIVSTYVLLNAEDYRWHWSSFASGASTALYVYLYAIYYFFTKTRMSGTMQTAYYFGYMGMFSIGLAILCGTVGYMGASLFVFKIYQYIKSD